MRKMCLAVGLGGYIRVPITMGCRSLGVGNLLLNFYQHVIARSNGMWFDVDVSSLLAAFDVVFQFNIAILILLKIITR